MYKHSTWSTSERQQVTTSSVESQSCSNLVAISVPSIFCRGSVGTSATTKAIVRLGCRHHWCPLPNKYDHWSLDKHHWSVWRVVNAKVTVLLKSRRWKSHSSKILPLTAHNHSYLGFRLIKLNIVPLSVCRLMQVPWKTPIYQGFLGLFLRIILYDEQQLHSTWQLSLKDKIGCLCWHSMILPCWCTCCTQSSSVHNIHEKFSLLSSPRLGMHLVI